MLPVSSAESDTTASTDGWLLSIHQSSKKMDLVWQSITLSLERELLVSRLEKY